ncbi:hypothetical protein TSH58p_28050 (plasmid) [Azospirillum sp. TSH58]|nr:hypothetical protein TSH58p_28050 [Azospirillum sp. TSH58]
MWASAALGSAARAAAAVADARAKRFIRENPCCIVERRTTDPYPIAREAVATLAEPFRLEMAERHEITSDRMFDAHQCADSTPGQDAAVERTAIR